MRSFSNYELGNKKLNQLVNNKQSYESAWQAHYELAIAASLFSLPPSASVHKLKSRSTAR
jgi:hypothetical protein